MDSPKKLLSKRHSGKSIVHLIKISVAFKNGSKYITFSFPIEEEVKNGEETKNGEEITKAISYRLYIIDSTIFSGILIIKSSE